MRDEWKAIVRSNFAAADSRSSPGLTRIGTESGLDRSASLNLAARAMKMKGKSSGQQSGGGGMMGARQREVSARRQVGDAEEVVNSPARTGKDGRGGEEPWWKNVSMEEGM